MISQIPIPWGFLSIHCAVYELVKNAEQCTLVTFTRALVVETAVARVRTVRRARAEAVRQTLLTTTKFRTSPELSCKNRMVYGETEQDKDKDLKICSVLLLEQCFLFLEHIR